MVSYSDEQIKQLIVDSYSDKKINVLAPVIKSRKGHYRELFEQIGKQGFVKVRVDGEIYEIDNVPTIDKNKKHDIEVVVDRLVVSEELGNRLPDSIETALGLSEGLLYVEVVSLPEDTESEKFKKGDLMVFSDILPARFLVFNCLKLSRVCSPSTARLVHVMRVMGWVLKCHLIQI